jgi:di/tripeptidase
VRPTQEQLLATLRTSLNDTLVPAIEDRWARYVATAMDLVLQHLALRVTGEAASLADDSADMVAVLAGVADRSATAGRAAEQAGDADGARAWETLATTATPTITDNDTSLASQTRQHEELRAAVVGVLRWLDTAGTVVDEAALTTLRDDLHHLIRRQTDRMTELVRPLFMAFGPVAS